MCIAIPGQIKSIVGEDILMRTAEVEFGGVSHEINLALLPEARKGQWVLVHAGVAIGIIDDEEALKTLDLLRQIPDMNSTGDD
jgi:hydrogenase expression/formation protein HypC